MVKVVGIIAPKETQEINTEGASYTEAYAALNEVVPEGWRLLSVRIER
ncbi:hypothetical protein [Arthrobacter methylotrophus]|uniref:DUF4177 domain-containing protein n=2 Tax=Arthrobacter methylotrophus TaxID=121291 RepID=A0ABV5UP02_9MICC